MAKKVGRKKEQHDAQKKMNAGINRSGKAKRKRVRNARRAVQNKIDSEAKCGIDRDVEMKDFE